VRTVARPHLEALVDESGETATLSVAGEPDAVTVDVVPAPHHVQGVTQLGRPSVAHATAAGKVMLAFTGRMPAPPLRAYTHRTITDLAALGRELERVRERGHAEAYEERELDLNAIAAPVFGADGALAGIIALQGPVSRFGRATARRLLRPLDEHAAVVSRRLGNRAGVAAGGSR
jgi:IclR family acetate operon transcriptional repressor